MSGQYFPNGAAPEPNGRGLAGDERGAVTVATGLYGLIVVLMVAGVMGVGSAFSEQFAADLEALTAVVLGLI